MSNKMLGVSEALMQDEADAEGPGTALDMNGCGSGTLHVRGVSGDSIAVEATIDGSNWSPISVVTVAGALATSITADGIYQITRCSVVAVRARIASASAGTITVWGRATAN